MNELEFRELSERTARIEAKVDMLANTISRVNQAEIAIARIDAGQKSAHHRIDGIYKFAGLLATGVSLVANLIFNLIR